LSPFGYSSYAAYVPETDTTVIVFRNQEIAFAEPDSIGKGLLYLAHGMTPNDLSRPVKAAEKWMFATLGTFTVLFSSGLIGVLLLSCLLPYAKTRVDWSILHALAAWFSVYINHTASAAVLSVDLLAVALYMLTLPIGLQRLATRPLHSGIKDTVIASAWLLMLTSGLAIYCGFFLLHLAWCAAAAASATALVRLFERRSMEKPRS
jgi:hypothetical protein